jgi:hypothetical protein
MSTLHESACAATHNRRGRPHPAWKRWLFRLGCAAASLAGAELLSWLGLCFLVNDFRRETLIERQESLAEGNVAVGTSAESIHPYLGWVLNPETNPGGEVNGRRVPVNRFGLFDDDHGVPRRGPDRVVVAVLGGSVASQMSLLGEQTLLERLRAAPEFAGKDVQIVRLAMSGYKQPQQLMALNYFLALGAEFDIVVNVDGFNEVALTVCENDPAGVFAAYPRAWHVRTMDIVDSRQYSSSYRLLEARAQRQELAAAARRSWLRWSMTYQLVWKVRDELLFARQNDLAATRRGNRELQGRGFHSDGPGQLYDTQQAGALDAHVVALWSNSSLQLSRLCEANGADYLHVLQPNQYHAGSKPLSAQELENYYTETPCHAQAVRRVYPLMIAEGARLREQGVRFHDLTMLFADVEETIYSDYFCHYNQRGNDLLAERVAGLIAEALEEQRP